MLFLVSIRLWQTKHDLIKLREEIVVRQNGQNAMNEELLSRTIHNDKEVKDLSDRCNGLHMDIVQLQNDLYKQKIVVIYLLQQLIGRILRVAPYLHLERNDKMEVSEKDLVARKESAECIKCNNYYDGWCRAHLKQMRTNEAGYCFCYDTTLKFSFYDVLAGKVSPSLARKNKQLRNVNTKPQRVSYRHKCESCMHVRRCIVYNDGYAIQYPCAAYKGE